ncbi:MAG: SOS response-associated peptidase family protein [Armatimonadetes bacterium]|nr:hypothetical protein [Armatimonadota bacterium]MBS1702154.1 SOS response-associated peptidase family protein [Armatimonadota bacterium]MBS1725763.1 SOS response-associated peptidase family protein [Armatimonadota bacterium]
MCLRYQYEYDQMDRDAIEVSVAAQAAFGSSSGDQSDAFPASITPIIILDNGKRVVVPSYFGMTPPWAKDETFGKKYAYNGRGETINERPTFQAPLRAGRRCLVRVVSFMENLGKNRWLKVSCVNPDYQLYIAGLYEEPNRHRTTISHCLVTTTPNELIEPYNDRMPVLLSGPGQDKWLDPKTSVFDALELLRPCPAEWLAIEEFEEVRRDQKYLDFGE